MVLLEDKQNWQTLARLIQKNKERKKRKRENQMNGIRNEKGEVTTDNAEI